MNDLTWIADTDWFWGICLVGFFMTFAKPLPKPSPATRRGKNRGTRKSAKAKVKQPRNAKAKPTTKPETPKWKPFMRYEDYTAESHERINKYHSRRDGVKPETDGWQNVGGVPIRKTKIF